VDFPDVFLISADAIKKGKVLRMNGDREEYWGTNEKRNSMEPL